MTLAALLAASVLTSLWTVPNTRFVQFLGLDQIITLSHPSHDYSPLPGLDLRDLDTGRVLRHVDTPWTPDGLGVTFAPDLKRFAWASEWHVGQPCWLAWRTPGASFRVQNEGTCGTRALAFSPDGATLAAANENGYVQLWNVATGERQATLMLRSRPDTIAFLPDGQMLLVAERFGPIGLWNVAPARKLRELEGAQGASAQLSVTPDGSRVLVSRFGGAEPGIYDTASGRLVAQLPLVVEPCPPGSPFKRCKRGPGLTSLSADGRRALVSYLNDTVVLYRFPEGKALATFPKVHYFATISLDGQHLLTPSGGWAQAETLSVYRLP